MNVRRIHAAVTLIGLLLTALSAAASDQVVFLVRHAEREATPAQGAPAAQPAHPGMMADDPPLNAAGQARAAKLAATLASADIRFIFTTEYRRTRQTAAPLAQKLKLTPVMAASKDPDPLVAQVRKAKGNVLIVGHSNTLPELLKKLGVKADVKIEDSEFDNLFVLVRPPAGEPTLIRLKY
jgi:broad specificity phosphatase PhoE